MLADAVFLVLLLVMIPLAVVGVVSPLLAAGVMAASSVMVVGNALRLRRYRPRSVLAERPALVPAAEPESSGTEPEPQTAEVAETVPAEAAEPEEASALRSELVTSEAPAQPIGRFARQEARKILRGLGRLFEKQWES